MQNDLKHTLADTVALQCRAIAEHHGHAWDHAVHAAVQRAAEACLTGTPEAARDAGPAPGIPSWLSPILKAVLAALMQAL